MPMNLIRTTLVLCLALGCSLPATALQLFGENCLQTLSTRTRIWSECRHKFSAYDARCKRPKYRMHQAMQQCASKGHDKNAIDAAMREGAQSAGTIQGDRKVVNPLHG